MGAQGMHSKDSEDLYMTIVLYTHILHEIVPQTTPHCGRQRMRQGLFYHTHKRFSNFQITHREIEYVQWCYGGQGIP